MLEFQECIENIENNKVIPHSTQNILKNLEFEEDIFIQEICKSLGKNNSSFE